MKKLLFGLVTIVFISCNNSKPVNYALFKGSIKNANSNELTIFDSSNKTVKKIEVSDTGTFSDTIFNANGYYRFNDGKETSSFYLEDGYDLYLNMDAKEFDESIVYSGNGNNPNNFLVQKFLIKEKTGSMDKLYSLNETAYLKTMNQLKETLEDSLANLDSEFKEQEKLNMKYEHINHIIKYENAHRFFTKNNNFKVSESFPDLLKDINLTNEEHYKKSDAYKAIVGYNFSRTVGKKAKENNISFETAALQFIKDSKNKFIRNDLLKGISRSVSVTNPNAKELYDGIMEISDDKDLKEKLKRQFHKIQILAKGKASPAFVNYENNAGGTTSLTDLKGKFVYIDIWATWCQPCKKEIPFLKEIEEKYHNKNIEFVSISVDTEKDHDTWKDMIKDKELGGIQLMADKDWKSEFITDYQVQGIPHFILIDPAGNIISSYAPRPSDKKLIDLFNELKI